MKSTRKHNLLMAGIVLIILIVIWGVKVEDISSLFNMNDLEHNNPFDCEVWEVDMISKNLGDYRINYGEPNISIFCYHIEREFNSKDDVISFIKEFEVSESDERSYFGYKFENFYDSNGIVNWHKVKNQMKTYKKSDRVIYRIDYSSGPGCNGNYLLVSEDGYFYHYRSSGH